MCTALSGRTVFNTLLLTAAGVDGWGLEGLLCCNSAETLFTRWGLRQVDSRVKEMGRCSLQIRVGHVS